MRNEKGQFVKGHKEGNRFKKGEVPWNKGIKIWNNNHPMLGRKNVSGENHHGWRGDNVKYRALHIWVEGQSGKANHCEKDKNHISTRYHWANISGEYKRDLADWWQLCPSCNLTDGVRRAERFTTGGAFL